MARTFKRLLALSDPHCGHHVGLTPPQWQARPERAQVGNMPSLVVEVQGLLWDEFSDTVRKLRPIDYCVLNGDGVEGKGWRSGATELITSDRDEQASMTARVLKYVHAREGYWLTYGTPYHTGLNEDWENVVADKIGGKIGSHEWLDIYGVVFDFKHNVGSSSIPHGRATPLAREQLWNALWAERDEQPKANVIVRSHVHYHAGCFGMGWLALTTPALQAAGTKYGARRCSGTVDLGVTVFDIYPNGSYQWQVIKFARAVHRAQATKLT